MLQEGGSEEAEGTLEPRRRGLAPSRRRPPADVDSVAADGTGDYDVADAGDVVDAVAADGAGDCDFDAVDAVPSDIDAGVAVYSDVDAGDADVARRVVARWRAVVAERKGVFLLRLLELSDLFNEEVLKRLDPFDLTVLAQVGRPWLAAGAYTRPPFGST
jgi:hypothetical protein